MNFGIVFFWGIIYNISNLHKITQYFIEKFLKYAKNNNIGTYNCNCMNLVTLVRYITHYVIIYILNVKYIKHSISERNQFSSLTTTNN
jgi:uncharacterized Fe-S radical SAM superfamily protein PflX